MSKLYSCWIWWRSWGRGGMAMGRGVPLRGTHSWSRGSHGEHARGRVEASSSRYGEWHRRAGTVALPIESWAARCSAAGLVARGCRQRSSLLTAAPPLERLLGAGGEGVSASGAPFGCAHVGGDVIFNAREPLRIPGVQVRIQRLRCARTAGRDLSEPCRGCEFRSSRSVGTGSHRLIARIGCGRARSKR